MYEKGEFVIQGVFLPLPSRFISLLNSYLLTSSYKTLYILEVHFEFFINEEQLDEVKCGFIARGAERRGQ